MMENSNRQLLAGCILAAFNQDFPDTVPTETEFYEKVNEQRKKLEPVYPVSDEDFARVVDTLQEQITVQMHPGEMLEDKTAEHVPWLAAAQQDSDFYFWNRYKRYLETVSGWSKPMTNSLDRVTNDILDVMGNPLSDTPFQRRGLVLGDVQSGKTAQYTGLINKAADFGYRIIVVLTSNYEGVRMQTQRRLDAEFAGHDSDRWKKDGSVRWESRIGVSMFGGTDTPQKHVAAFTSVGSDFKEHDIRNTRLRIQSVEDPMLLVLKKNSNVLAAFNQWLDFSADPATGVIQKVPLLLIDDEADNASINTNKPEEDPTTINTAIREILNKFDQATYLGITATPYANVFIEPDQEHDMIGYDLFPRDFIYALSPPSNYIGADQIFGDANPSYSSQVLQPLEEAEIQAYYPDKHSMNWEVEELPDSMKTAGAYFLLANVIRDIRGDTKKHRSMLVHVSRFTEVQNRTGDVLNEWLNDVKTDVRNYACCSAAAREKNESMAFLHSVWERYGMGEMTQMEIAPGKKSRMIEWDEICTEWLYPAIAPIMIKTVNQTSGSASLDYHAYRDQGMRVIAVGGNSLSRGLTLEGLMVSYFHRKTSMSDTLLQMGRWFGYRPKYADLVRIWIDRRGIDWFGYITRMNAELRDQIATMNDLHKTPRDFGIAVRTDPNGMQITAANKMRTAKRIKRPVRVAGRLLETPRLPRDPDLLKENEELVKNFVTRLASSGAQMEKLENGSYYWRGVPKDMVANLTQQFHSHAWHLAFQGPQLANYVRKGSAGLEWDVVLLTEAGSGGPYPKTIPYGDKDIEIPRTEKRIYSFDTDSLSISGTKARVGAGGSTRIGLSAAKVEEIRKDYKEAYPEKNVPDSAYLIPDRNPLLMLHVIQAKNAENAPVPADIPEFLVALGLGFPRTSDAEGPSAEMAEYAVNVVEAENWLAPIEDE